MEANIIITKFKSLINPFIERINNSFIKMKLLGKTYRKVGQWWHMPLVTVGKAEVGGSLRVHSKPGLQSEFQDRQGYTQSNPAMTPTAPSP